MLRAADRRTSPPPSHSPPPFRTPLVRDYNRLTSAAPAWIEPNTIDSRPRVRPCPPSSCVRLVGRLVPEQQLPERVLIVPPDRPLVAAGIDIFFWSR